VEKASFVLAFDPSLNATGYAVLDIRGKRPKLAEVGHVKGRNASLASEPTSVKLALIAAKTKELVAKYHPLHKKVFLERGFTKFNNSTQATFRARGALESELVGYEVIELPPTTVKKIISDYGLAHKQNVAECVADYLNVPVETFETEDESDAAAVAVAGWLKHIKEGEQ
jgi:crossover junction endodeoxyribonuclease RuvC